MNLSVGVLYSAQTLLEEVHKGGLHTSNFGANFSKIDVADGQLVLATAQKCRWLKIEHDGAIVLTDRGEELHGLGPSVQCLREQLFDVIVSDPPPWSRKIIQGRFEAIQSMPLDAKQCFTDCALTTGFDKDVVRWWDRTSEGVRIGRSRVNHLVGRHAERLSLAFEKARTGRQPIWKAVDSNVAGYDILSTITDASETKLKIEVKGTRMGKSQALFSLTRNEWNTATHSVAYQFHLWILNAQPKLFVVDAADISPHVPADQSDGKWSYADVPFRAFSAFETQLSAPFHQELTAAGVKLQEEFALD